MPPQALMVLRTTIPPLQSCASRASRARFHLPRQNLKCAKHLRAPRQRLPTSHRTIHTTSHGRIDAKPTGPKPTSPPQTDSQPSHPTEPTPLTDSAYHNLSTQFFDDLVQKLEDMAEEQEGLDVEYSAGVLTVITPTAQSYVLNKQPPNKQIWLSSPISGPKRFDWCVTSSQASEGQDGQGGLDSMGAKRGGESGDWVCLRDGTRLGALLEGELGVDVAGGA